MNFTVTFPKYRKNTWKLMVFCITAAGGIFVYIQLISSLVPQPTIYEVHIGQGNHVVIEYWDKLGQDVIPTAEIDESRNTLPAQKCKMPELLPGDQEIFNLDYQQFLDLQNSTPKCLNPNSNSDIGKPNVTSLTKFAINYNSELIKLNPASNFWKDTNCYYQILRGNVTQMFYSYRLEKEVHEITEEITILPPQVETIQIYCNNTNSNSKTGTSYKDYLSQVKEKPELENILKNLSATQNPSNYPSVLILGIDSVSRMNFQRYMPKVHDFLVNVMKAVDFKGFNSGGNLTPYSLWPLFSGLSYSELEEACDHQRRRQTGHQYPEFFGSSLSHDFLHECHFIWEDFRKKGYRTSYSEEGTWYGINTFATFQNQKTTFDYDFRAVISRLEKIHNITTYTGCYGPRLTIDVMLENFMKTAEAFSALNKPVWHYSWTWELTHDVNYMSKYAEPYLLQALQKIHNNQWLNNTILILLSDHGMRFGPLRQKTRQGFLEERLPFLYIVLPEAFKTRFPASLRNMILNSDKLATTFDVHATMKDILNLESLEVMEKHTEFELESNAGKDRGVSLFRQISDERTCDMIGIPTIYCACTTRTNVSTEDSQFIQQIAEVAVQGINKKLAEHHPYCDQLKLDRVTNAVRLTSGSGGVLESKKDARHFWTYFSEGQNKVAGLMYEVGFETSPGGGDFYASVFQNSGSSAIKITDINRISAYGTDAACMDIRERKPFCYCNKNSTSKMKL